MSSILALILTLGMLAGPVPRFHPVIVRPVPMAWVTAFLAWDTTDANLYGPEYVCADFAADLVSSARRQGLAAWSVVVLFTHEIGHVITVFETTDQGLVYVEPQSDTLYPVVEVGQRLCSADENICFGGIEPIRKIIIESQTSE
jgi:hypothetical protein